MKKYNVICIGYKNPSKNAIIKLLEIEKNWLENFENDSRKILIHPGICIKETDVYNSNVLNEYSRKKYTEYNLDASELETKYDFNALYEFKIAM
jgi:hypothetical protein